MKQESLMLNSLHISLEEFEQLQAQKDRQESQLQAWMKTAQELQNKLNLSQAEINQTKQESELIKSKLFKIKIEFSLSKKQLISTEKELLLTKFQLHQTQEELAHFLNTQHNSEIA